MKSLSTTIHLKAILSSTFLWCCLLMLVKVIQTFVSVDEILKHHYSPKSYRAVFFCGTVVLWYMLYKMVLTFESVGGILKYHYSPKSYRAVLSSGIVHYAVQDGSNF